MNNTTTDKCMGETRQSRVTWSISTRHCALCGTDLKDKKIIGSGSFDDGIFCSLDCYTNFNSSEIIHKYRSNSKLPEQ